MENFFIFIVGCLAMFGFALSVSLIKVSDLAPQKLRIECERNLPRSQSCEWVSVPTKEEQQ